MAKGTDVAALAVGAVAAVLAMFLVAGAYSSLSSLVSLTLLLVLAGFVFGYRRHWREHLAIGATAGLTVLPLIAFLAQEAFKQTLGGLAYALWWAAATVAFTLGDHYWGKRTGAVPTVEPRLPGAAAPAVLQEQAEGRWGDRLYRRWENPAHWTRTACQMLVGVAIASLLIFKAVLSAMDEVPLRWEWLDQIEALALVGKGLAFAAGFELAYMLFTSGPDEAVEPLILGFAAAALLVVSKTESWPDAIAALLLALGVGLLFLIRRLVPARQAAPVPPPEKPRRRRAVRQSPAAEDPGPA